MRNDSKFSLTFHRCSVLGRCPEYGSESLINDLLIRDKTSSLSGEKFLSLVFIVNTLS